MSNTETTLDTGADIVRVYELGYHFVSTLSESEVEAELSALRAAVEKFKGEFIAEGAPQLIELAYPMYISDQGKRTEFTKSYFGWLKFAFEPENAEALKEIIDQNKNLLRYLLITTVREDTTVLPQTGEAQEGEVLQEVKTDETIAAPRKETAETSEEVSEEDLDRSIDELVSETEEIAKDDTRADEEKTA